MTPKEKEYSRFKQVCIIKNNSKQKAEDLVWKFGKGVNKLEMSYIQAKECALIAVNEILESFIITIPKHQTEFWEQVKQEIINL